MGAWDTYTAADGTQKRYFQRTQPLTWFTVGSPKAIGCVSFKNELAYNDIFVDKFDPSKPVIGLQADEAIRLLQQKLGIGVDGIAGPQTLKAACKKRVDSVQSQLLIPNNLLCKMLGVESNYDPSAIGSEDPEDRGISQINFSNNPGVSDAEAFDVAFAIPWSGRTILNHFNTLGDWDAAVVSYNVGVSGASKWLAAGKPASGGPQIGTKSDGTPRFLYTTAHEYISAVKAFPC